MQLDPGTRVGSFEIRSRLGAGGMGEVYRAHDTKLHRDVALKVLPELFTADAERLARFEREAQVLASLNHEHIAAIYGLEQSGSPSAFQFLILELVEGETLDDRLKKTGALPLPDVVSIAKQIADGLQAAHERGIVHRDLKPSNIALTHDGHVKVLDFGLAKLEGDGTASPIPPGSDPNAATMPPLAGLSKSPTMMPAAMTAAGMILGTAPYMSPEQAKGRPADKRSDVWAFGCVFYEMLTGKPAFAGEDVSDTLANVLKAEPDWTAVPGSVPAPIRTLLHKCLEKDRRKRIADISVASFVLSDADVLRPPTLTTSTTTQPSSWKDRALTGVVAVILGSAVTGGLVWYSRRPPPANISRLAITTTGTAAALSAGNDRQVAISPDGKRVAYVGANGTILVRALDQLDATAITGLGLPRGLFFSPDGQWIGFFDAALAMKKVSAAGGQAVTVCRTSGPARGAVWTRDDTIVFATNDPSSGLLRVPAGGGDPAVLTTPNRKADEGDHLWPELLPDGRVLFTVAPATNSIENARIAVFDPRRGTQKIVVERGTDAHYVSSGHLVYALAGTMRAVAFDPDRLEVHGTPVQVLPQMVTTRFGGGEFDVSQDGTLVYRPPNVLAAPRSIVWVDRQGREEATAIPARAYQLPRLSPDGKRAAVEIQGDIWIWDVGRDTIRRLTFDPAPDWFPLWTHDGTHVLFGSDRTSNGQANIFRQSADGSGPVQRLTESPNQQFPMSVTPDGKSLVFRESAPSMDLMLMSLDDRQQPPRALLNTPFAEQNGEISPDGRWLAYQSNETGRFEIYVRPFPDVDAGRWQISVDGGIQPSWSKKGDELFYAASTGASTRTMMAVHVDAAKSWSAGNPVKLFDDPYYHGSVAAAGRMYDIAADRRFLMIKQAGAGESTEGDTFIVVQHWVEELRRLVPRK